MSVHDDWLLTPARAAVHLPTATAVLSDLHLGYAETRRGNGEAVPAARLEDVLAPLGAMLSLHGVKRLVIAGDLFEAGPRTELARRLLAWVEAAGVKLLGVVPGNHDRNVRAAKCGLPVSERPLLLGAWHVVHGDAPLPDAPVVQGHLHPCLRPGRGVAAPCYLASDRHLILPAYSAETVGLNVLRPVGWDHYRCHAIVGDSVLDYGVLAELREKVAASKR
jgi:metallophosphoesterase superfamily enzyme